VIAGIVLFCYGLAPLAGALAKRYSWFRFRSRFSELRLHPIMDSRAYWQMEAGRQAGGAQAGGAPMGGAFRFIGELESLSDEPALWVRGEGLLVPVSLKNAETYLLPAQSGEGIPETSDPGEEAPEKIRWEKIAALAEGTKVFVGGKMALQDGRWCFVSTKESPSVVIFYDGPDHSLATKAIWAGRHRGEYFNPITPYALIIGALCLLFVAAAYLPRPAFRPTVLVSVVALFVPLFPLVPPGLLFTVAYRRLTWRSRMLRAYSDLAKLPLRYFAEEGCGRQRRSGPRRKAGDSLLRERRALPNGELYGFACSAKLPPEVHEGKIPMLIPEITELGEGESWHIFGAMRPSDLLPFRPKDPFATFGVLPGNPRSFALRCAAKAYALETVAWLMMLAGIALNVFFLRLVLSVLL